MSIVVDFECVPDDQRFLLAALQDFALLAGSAANLRNAFQASQRDDVWRREFATSEPATGDFLRTWIMV